MPLYHKQALTSIFIIADFLYFLKYNLTNKRLLQARIHTPDNLHQNQEEASTYEYNFKHKFTENIN